MFARNFFFETPLNFQQNQSYLAPYKLLYLHFTEQIQKLNEKIDHLEQKLCSNARVDINQNRIEESQSLVKLESTSPCEQILNTAQKENLEASSQEETPKTHGELIFNSPASSESKERIFYDKDEQKSDEEEPEFKITRRNEFRKVSRRETPNNKRSIAKHLWVTYGRKIGEFALTHSEGDLREWIRKNFKKLDSKGGYSKVLRVMSTDTKEEIKFKKSFVGLAIKFLKNHLEDAFANSNYRNELLQQSGRVLRWITSMI